MISSNNIINKYAKHNKDNFSFKNYNNDNSKILIEFHGWSSAHICFSYLIEALNKKFKSKLTAYEGYTLISANLKLTTYQKLKYFLSKNFVGKFFKLYRSFGVTEFIRPSLSESIIAKSNKEFNLSFNKINKYNLSEYEINGIRVGDLIYDTYLKIFKQVTLDTKSTLFKNFFKDSLKLYFYWDDYFKNNKIKAMVIVHSTYLYGIPIRIACLKKIPVFKGTFNTIYHIRKKNYHTGQEFFTFKEKYKKLNPKIKKNLFLVAKNNLDNLSLNISKKRSIKKHPKVLIAAHNFYDSPHVFGKMLFPDFYEWLKFIVKEVSKNNLECFLKLHPKNNNKEIHLINEILKKNNKIKLLKPNTRLEKILKLGIQYVFTCYGTVGYEYAYYGLTVINSSKTNPHIQYKFNIHPKNIIELKKIIENVEKYKIKIKRKEIIEFFVMRRFYYVYNWLNINRKKFLKGFGWKTDIYKPKMYDEWMKQWNEENHKRIQKEIKNFISTKSYRLINPKYL